MRTLKYAILGLVNREPMTGYDILKKFNESLGDFWHAKHSQIYPELKKLTDEGNITFETIIEVEKQEKKVYSITSKGKNELQIWLQQIDELGPTPKDKFRLKVYFCDEMDKECVLNQINNAIMLHTKKLDYLNAHKDLLTQNPNIQNPKDSLFGDFLVLNGAILREESYITWLKYCLNRINYYYK